METSISDTEYFARKASHSWVSFWFKFQKGFAIHKRWDYKEDFRMYLLMDKSHFDNNWSYAMISIVGIFFSWMSIRQLPN